MTRVREAIRACRAKRCLPATEHARATTTATAVAARAHSAAGRGRWLLNEYALGLYVIVLVMSEDGGGLVGYGFVVVAVGIARNELISCGNDAVIVVVAFVINTWLYPAPVSLFRKTVARTATPTCPSGNPGWWRRSNCFLKTYFLSLAASVVVVVVVVVVDCG